MSEEETKRITEKLHDIEMQMQKIISHMESEQGTLQRIASDLNKSVNRLNSTVYGNGNPGLTEQNRRLMEWYDRHTQGTAKALWLGIAAFFTALASFFKEAITHLFK